MKVQIVKLFPDFGNVGIFGKSYWSPGILAVASAVRALNPDAIVEMIDGTLDDSLDVVCARLDMDSEFIGFSVETSNLSLIHI